VLSCPRRSPEWELAARLALVKPKPYTKDKIAHRDPEQRLPRNARRIVAELLPAAPAQYPASGEHRLIVSFEKIEPSRAKRSSRKLSRSLPELWFELTDETGHVSYLRDGVSYLRAGKYKLELVRASRVRLRRAVRFGFFAEIDQHAKSRHRQRAGAHAQPQ
jgi:hypothetical protein